jgi:hypothetical protein
LHHRLTTRRAKKQRSIVYVDLGAFAKTGPINFAVLLLQSLIQVQRHAVQATDLKDQPKSICIEKKTGYTILHPCQRCA